MSMFKDEQEVYAFLGGIFDDAMADDELGPRFAESGVVLQLNYSDPDSQVLVDMPNRKVFKGDLGGAPDPAVEMFMKADVGHKFWLGEVNISVALAKGTMRAKGPVPKILKLVPLAKELFPRYRAMIEAEGRHDLLEV